jgi:hypothetical protein
MLVMFSLAPPTQAETINLRGPISATVFNPCTGEDVDLSGSLHLQVQFVANGAGGGHFRIQINAQGVGGVGVDSGNQYRGTGVLRFTIAAAGPTEHITLDGHLQLISQGSSSNLRVHFTLHFVANPNSTVVVDNIHGGCQ